MSGLKQDAGASQVLQHQPAGSRIHLPEPTCLGEREPQSGHLAKLSAHALNQNFHRCTPFPHGSSTYGLASWLAVIVARQIVLPRHALI